MKTTTLAGVVAYMLFILTVNGFFPLIPPSKSRNSKTHKVITRNGIIQAVASYIYVNKTHRATDEDGAFREFYGTDAWRNGKFPSALSNIWNAISDTQTLKADKAYVHCHADQIELAHNYILSCKQRLVSRNANLDRKENLEEMHRQLGECLYTVQSFYSNTNWVELNGSTPYLDFGVRGKQLMPIADSPDEDTCRDMPDDLIGCHDNLITDKLTSGYYEGRGNRKPLRDTGASSGKCSHGGLADESRKLVAKCGINKETFDKSLSPHHHLHQQAYEAAVEATKLFLIGEDGVLSRLGSHAFDSIFHVFRKSEVSLAFAVDYSGSMGTEIAAVKYQITQIVTSVMQSDNRPANYVLSLFNDPASLNRVDVFSNGYDMINAVTNIVVDGGDDCPELAMAGILQAIRYAKPGSSVMVFTDADAKDADREQEVVKAAKEKYIKIESVLTGSCSRRKRSHNSTYRSKRSSLSLFQRLAEETGGKVYETSKANIAETLVKVLEDVFPVSEILIDTYTWKDTVTKDKEIIVDESIQVIKISVVGGAKATDVNFVNKNGQIQVFPEEKAKRIYTDKKEIIMSLQHLEPGSYYLRRSVNKPLNVHITAQSTITMEGTMYQHTKMDSLLALTGSPVVGTNYTYFVTAINLVNSTCNGFVITGESGDDIYSVETQTVVSDVDVVFTATIPIPNQAFRIKVNVTDNTGMTWYRTMPELYRPSSVQLTVTSPADDIPVNQETDILYMVTNTGASNDTYTITLNDDQNFNKQQSSRNLVIAAGESESGAFKLRPTRAIGMFTYNVQLFLQPLNEVKQSIKKTLFVTETERPHCTVIFSDFKCEAPSLNTGNCSLYPWNATLNVNFKNTQLNAISATQNVTLLHEDIKSVKEGPVVIIVSSDCCSPMVSVSAVDVDGFISQCVLDLSDGRPVIPVIPVTYVEVVTDTHQVRIKHVDSPDNVDIWVIVVAAVGGLILVTAIVAVTIVIKQRNTGTLEIANGGKERGQPEQKTYSFAYKIVKSKNDEDINVESDQ